MLYINQDAGCFRGGAFHFWGPMFFSKQQVFSSELQDKNVFQEDSETTETQTFCMKWGFLNMWANSGANYLLLKPQIFFPV